MLPRSSPFRTISRCFSAIVINACLLALVGYAFWVADWQYSLPTPRPDGLVQPPLGSRLALPAGVSSLRRENRPLVVNFANAQCPCTEFNLDHLRRLQKMFGDKVDFMLVLESSADAAGSQAEFQSMHLRMPVLYDHAEEASTALGVYGTPQAAVLDDRGRLYYRGNYNRSRYCNEESSEYVRIALSALVQNRSLPSLPPDAAVTYGCPLPHRFGPQTANQPGPEGNRL
jgi:Iodothyronine deiodinase